MGLLCFKFKMLEIRFGALNTAVASQRTPAFNGLQFFLQTFLIFVNFNDNRRLRAGLGTSIFLIEWPLTFRALGPWSAIATTIN